MEAFIIRGVTKRQEYDRSDQKDVIKSIVCESIKYLPKGAGEGAIGMCVSLWKAELRIRGVIEDNSKIMFFNFSMKTYVVTPNYNYRGQVGFNDGSKHIF